jgi:hypothetical protein
LVIGIAGTLAALNRDWLVSRWIMFAAENLGTPIEQQVGFATAADGTRIAYATTGEGPPIVIVLGWATHLREGFNSPTYDQQGLLALTSEHHAWSATMAAASDSRTATSRTSRWTPASATSKR